MPLWSRCAKVALIEDISGASTIVGGMEGLRGLTLIETIQRLDLATVFRLLLKLRRHTMIAMSAVRQAVQNQ